MWLKRIASILLLIQALLFLHLMTLLSGTALIGHVPAHGGAVTAYHIDPPALWGGIHGTLGTGTDWVAVNAGTITAHDIPFDDEDNTCLRTQVLASITPVRPQDLSPITPEAADGILGIPAGHGLSVTTMFTEREVYDIAGTLHTLWSTRTQGKHTEYLQGVAQANGSLVFVTDTVRIGYAYDGTPTNYQLLLPAGTWQLQTDLEDSCILLDDYERTGVNGSTETQLDAAIDQRICVGQPHTITAVYSLERVYCMPEDVGSPWCIPASGVEARITRDGETLLTRTTPANGTIIFTPETPGTHTITLNTDTLRRTRHFSAEHCLPHGTLTEDDAYTITLATPEVTTATFPSGEPSRTETPASLQQQIDTDFLLIVILTVLILCISIIGWFEKHKDDRVLALRLRLWWRTLRR